MSLNITRKACLEDEQIPVQFGGSVFVCHLNSSEKIKIEQKKAISKLPLRAHSKLNFFGEVLKPFLNFFISLGILSIIGYAVHSLGKKKFKLFNLHVDI